MPEPGIFPDNDVTIILNQIKAIASAVTQAAEAGDLEEVLEQIAQVSRELVHARYAALGIPDGQGGLRFFKVAGMSAEAYARIQHLPTGYGLLGAIMRERKTLRLARMRDDPRSGGFCAMHPVMTSLLGVPVMVGERLFGMLYLCDREDGQPFSEVDQWLIETIAGYAALAIAGSQLSEQQRRLALLEERDRISMELHDGVIQSLYAIGMGLDLLRSGEQIQPDALMNPIQDINAVIEDIRRYILNLKTETASTRTIYDTLAEILARFTIPSTLSTTLDALHTAPPFSASVFEAIGQIVNEAISNAVRHADAQHLTITARQDGEIFEVVIADDGKGFISEGKHAGSGLGLRNMQARARLHGGRVEVKSAAGQGTQVIIRIPVRPA
jgi:signal transduction histidine kinase